MNRAELKLGNTSQEHFLVYKQSDPCWNIIWSGGSQVVPRGGHETSTYIIAYARKPVYNKEVKTSVSYKNLISTS